MSVRAILVHTCICTKGKAHPYDAHAKAHLFKHLEGIRHVRCRHSHVQKHPYMYAYARAYFMFYASVCVCVCPCMNVSIIFTRMFVCNHVRTIRYKLEHARKCIETHTTLMHRDAAPAYRPIRASWPNAQKLHFHRVFFLAKNARTCKKRQRHMILTASHAAR